MNWLANLSGLENGFKEMDLLQEHQNFWDKVSDVSVVTNLSLSEYFRSSTMPRGPTVPGIGWPWSRFAYFLCVKSFEKCRKSS
jgi:hypothetical protein